MIPNVNLPDRIMLVPYDMFTITALIMLVYCFGFSLWSMFLAWQLYSVLTMEKISSELSDYLLYQINMSFELSMWCLQQGEGFLESSYIVAQHFIDEYSGRVKIEYTYSGNNKENFTRGTQGSAGFDLVIESVVSQYGTRTMYETNVAVAIPPEYVGMVFERSSLHKKGYRLANTVGIIDSDYRNTIKVCLEKIDPNAPDLELNQRVAQFVPVKHCNLVGIRRDNLNVTGRTGGFGSTG